MTDAIRRQTPAFTDAAASGRSPGASGAGEHGPHHLGPTLPGIRPRASGAGTHFVAPTGATRPLAAAQPGDPAPVPSGPTRPRAPAIAGGATLAPRAAAPASDGLPTAVLSPSAAAELRAPVSSTSHVRQSYGLRDDEAAHGDGGALPNERAPGAARRPAPSPAPHGAVDASGAPGAVEPGLVEPREVAAPASADEAVRSLAATIEDLLAESEMPTPRSFDVLRIPGAPARRADDAKPLAAAEGKSPARIFRGRQLPPPPPIFKIAGAQTNEVARTGDLVGDIASEIARQLRGTEAASDVPGAVNHTNLVAHDGSAAEEPRENDIAEWTASREPYGQSFANDRPLARNPAPTIGEPHTAARFLSEHETPLSRQSEQARAVPHSVDVPQDAHAAPWNSTPSSVAARIPPAPSRDARSLAIAAAERYEPAAAQTDWYGVPIETTRATDPAPNVPAAEPAHATATDPHQLSDRLPDRATAQPADTFATAHDARYDYAIHAQADDASHDPMDSPRIVTSRMAQPVPSNQHSRIELTSADEPSEQLPRWLSLSRDNPSSRRAGRTGLIVGGALAAAALLGYAGAGGIDLVRGLWSLPENATNEPVGATTLVAAEPTLRNADPSARPAKAALMALLGGQEDKFEENETNAAAVEGAPTFPVRTATLGPELPATALLPDNRTAATGAVEPIYAEAKVTVPTADEVRAFLQALRRGADQGETRSAALARAEANAADTARLDSQRNGAAATAPVPEPVQVQTEGTSAPTGGVSTIKRTAPASIPEGAPISNQDAAGLFARVREYLDKSDVASARLLLEHLALSGSREAAERLARSYDPAHVADLSLAGLHPDRDKAIKWYRKAAELGSVPAGARLVTLEQTQPPRN